MALRTHTLRRRRLPIGLFAVCALLAGSLALFTTGASAGTVGINAGFEDDDANLAPNGGTPNFDWNSLSTPTVPNWIGTAPYRTTTKTVDGWQFVGLEDAAATNTDTGFAGGTKQDDDCSTVNGSKAPNKDDLARVYLAAKTKNVGTVPHVFLTLGWIRIPQNTVSASAHVGYEFNKGENGNCGGGSSLKKRTGGDMLVVYNFEGGADDPTINLSRWLKTGEYLPAGATCEVNSSSADTGCWGDTKELTGLGYAEGAVNFAATRNPPLTSDTIKPSGATNPGNAEFGEAGIDLTDAGVFAAGSCETFGQVYAVSRSSGSSSQAAMKDIVGPGNFLLTNCASVNVTKSGSTGPVSAQAGAVFTLYNGPTTSGTVVGTCTVSVTGQCGTNPSFADLQPGQYTIDETTIPTGFNKAAGLPLTFTLVAGEAKVLAFENPAAPGDVNIAKDDDAGDPLDGAIFTLYQGENTSGTVVGTCTTGVSDYPVSTTPSIGTCSFNDLPSGTTYTVNETFVPAGYALPDSGLPATFFLGNGATVDLPSTGNAYVDPRLFKAIVLVCQESDGTLYPSTATVDTLSAGTTLSRANLDSLLPTLTAGERDAVQAALCGLTTAQGARGGLRAAPHSSNPHSAGINIPN